MRASQLPQTKEEIRSMAIEAQILSRKTHQLSMGFFDTF
jgi:hypothetical protein